MGILTNGIKTRKMSEELEIFEKVGKYEVYEINEDMWKEISELFSKAEQEKMGDGQYNTTFGKEASIRLFNILTNIDMTESTYEKYATKRNGRLALVQQYISEVINTYLLIAVKSVENAKLSEGLGVEKPKNRNDKVVILEQMKKNETERKAQEVVDEGIENGHIVEIGETKSIDNIDDEIADLERKIKEKKRADLLKQLKELGE